jgi:hypothetical protein
MQDLAQCEYSLCHLGVSKKNVDHGAAGAEVPLKTLHTPYIGFSYIYIYVLHPFADYIQAKFEGCWGYRQCSSSRIVWT